MQKNSIGKQLVSIKGDMIEIYRTDLGIRAYTSYQAGMEDFVNELRESLWTPSSNKDGERKYIQRSNKSKTQRLHEFVFNHLYGEAEVKNKHKEGFIIEHIDDDPLNNCFENLAFLSRSGNKRKADGLDKIREENKYSILTDIRIGAISKKFQINIRFNEQVPVIIEGETYTDMYELNFLYDDTVSYEEVLAEVQRIQKAYTEDGCVCFSEAEQGFTECIGSRESIQKGVLPIMLSTRAVKEWL